jgi:Flp pilus assembly protein TadD
MTEQQIREKIAAGSLTYEDALSLVEQALAAVPSAGLWLLRGQLIQLSEGGSYRLEDAAASYQEAARLAPADPEPLAELGHFYDSVMVDPVQARRFYEAAISKGAGEECVHALTELLKEARG